MYNVIIAGAGPAGTAAAIVLKEAGLKVGVVDNPIIEKFKVGESIPAATQRLLKRLGLNTISALLTENHYKSCLTNASAWGSEQWHYQDAILNPEGNGWHIHRNHFDDALRNYAMTKGVEFINGIVRNLNQTTNHYEIIIANKSKKTSIINTEWLIDATGRANKISRLLKIEQDILSEQMAAVVWVEDDGIDNATRIKSVANGWWYTAALPEKRRVIVFHGLKDDVTTMVHHPIQFVTAFNQAKLISSPIHPYQFLEKISARKANVRRLQHLNQTNFMAVGDAILSFDPLASQGIFFALYSGIKAGEAIIQSHNTPNRQQQFIQHYFAAVQKVFEHNQHTRAYFYKNELRFKHETYWKTQQSSF